MEAIDALPVGIGCWRCGPSPGWWGAAERGPCSRREAGDELGEIADRLGTSRQRVEAVRPRGGGHHDPRWRAAVIGRQLAAPAGHSLRTYSSCASYKAVTTRPPSEVAP